MFVCLFAQLIHMSVCLSVCPTCTYVCLCLSNLYFCQSLCLTVCLSNHSSVSVCPSVHVSVSFLLSICLYLDPSTDYHLSVLMIILLFVHLYISLSIIYSSVCVHPSVRPSVHPSIRLSVVFHWALAGSTLPLFSATTTLSFIWKKNLFQKKKTLFVQFPSCPTQFSEKVIILSLNESLLILKCLLQYTSAARTLCLNNFVLATFIPK
jgi:hypothetical protein